MAKASAVFDRLVPEICDWPTHEGGAEDCPARPGENESHQAVAQDPEESVWKDAQVLQENRELGQEQREVVDDD